MILTELISLWHLPWNYLPKMGKTAKLMTRAEAHGRGGEAVDVLPVQEGVLQCLCRDAVGGWVVELREQTDFPDRGVLRPFALATALKRGNHVLTQWGHELSPFVSGRVVRLRRKTS